MSKTHPFTLDDPAAKHLKHSSLIETKHKKSLAIFQLEVRDKKLSLQLKLSNNKGIACLLLSRQLLYNLPTISFNVLISLSAQTVLRVVVAPCYQHHQPQCLEVSYYYG